MLRKSNSYCSTVIQHLYALDPLESGKVDMVDEILAEQLESITDNKFINGGHIDLHICLCVRLFIIHLQPISFCRV